MDDMLQVHVSKMLYPMYSHVREGKKKTHLKKNTFTLKDIKVTICLY